MSSVTSAHDDDAASPIDVAGSAVQRRRRRAARSFAVALLAILLVATVARALPVRAGLPYSSYVDEQEVLRPAASLIANHTLLPPTYNYPPLTMYATVAVSAVLQVLPGGASVIAGARATVRDPIESNIHSSDLIFGGKVAVLAFGSGTVLIAALLAARLSGRRAGVIAALFTAATPALLARSAIVIVDTPATFFVTACLFCASHIVGDRRALVWAVLAGAAAGFATAAKYPSGLVILAVFTVVALATEQTLRERSTLACGAAAACLLAATISAPTLVLRTSHVIDELRLQSRIYESKTTTTYWHELMRGREVGVLLVVLALVGFVELLRAARTRPLMIGYTIFAATMVAWLARYSFQPFRNVLPLVPFLGCAAAVAIVAVVDALGRAAHLGYWVRAGLIGTLAVVVCVVMLASGWRPYFDERVNVSDARIKAREWLADRVDGDDVLVAQEVAFLPSELHRLHGKVSVRSLGTTLTSAGAARFKYIVVGDRPSAKQWLQTLANRKVAAVYGFGPTFTAPSSYRGPGQIIRVFDAAGTRDPRECFPFCG